MNAAVRIGLACCVAALLFATACSKRSDRQLANLTAAADTCRAAAKTSAACKKCCPHEGAWKFEPQTGCTCLVPVRCTAGDQDLKACTRCCERAETGDRILVGPVFDPRTGCACQFF